MRLIDVDALRESLDIDVFDCFKCKHGVSIYGYCSRGGEFQKACNEIEFAQTIDVAPVVHGKWEWISSTYDRIPCEKRYQCSKCHHETITHESDPWEKFCPHCGARMDGKGNGDETD